MTLGQVRRFLARQYLQEWAKQQISGNKALQMLKGIRIPRSQAQKFGIDKSFRLGYRRTDFYADYRELTGAVQSAKYVKAVGKDKKLDPRRLPDLDMDIDKGYMYTVKFDLYNPDSGESDTVFRRGYSDKIMSRNDAALEVSRQFGLEPEQIQYLGYDSEKWEIVDSNTIEVFHHQGWGY